MNPSAVQCKSASALLQARSQASPLKVVQVPKSSSTCRGKARMVTAQAAPAAQQQQTTERHLPSQAAKEAAFTEGFAPEQAEALPLQISGSIPNWLKGSYVRNGPGTFKGVKHLFDGYGMIVKFAFENGKVSTQQRFVQSNAFKEFIKRDGHPKYNEFGTARPTLESLPVIAAGVAKVGQGFTDNATVNVFPSNAEGSELLAVTESVKGTYRMDSATLATKYQEEYSDSVNGDLNTAHPKVLSNGQAVNIVSGFGDGYHVVKQQPEGHHREEIAKIGLSNFPAPSWIHDFPVTENYVIVPETPCVFSVGAALTLNSAPYVQFNWKPEQGSILHVVPLNGDATKIRHIKAPSYFTFHYVNAYEAEDGSNINIDFGNFETPDMLNDYYLSNMREMTAEVKPAPLSRMTLPLTGQGETTIRKIMKNDDEYTYFELPRMNPHYKGKEYRYAYAVSAKLPASYGNALSKFDVQEGTTKQWFEEGCIPVEPLMVPHPDAKSEDDGVVMTIVMGADGKSFLLCLDAQSFEELGRAHLPYGIPFGFHASFVPA